MKRINKVTLAFLFLISIVLGGVWQFIQSEKFALFVSKKITSTISSQYKAKLEFRKLDIQIFPPSTTFKDVSLSDFGKKRKFSVRAGSLGIYFGILDFFASKFSISKVKVVDGDIDLDVNLNLESSNKKSTSKLDHKKIYEGYVRVVNETLPIRLKAVELERVRVNLNQESISVESASAGLYRNALTLDAHIENLNLFEKKFSFLKHDSLSFDVELTESKFRVKSIEVKNGLNKYSFEGRISLEKEIPELEGIFNYKGGVKNILTMGDLNKYIIGDMDGFIDLEAKINGPITDPDVQLETELHGFKSFYANVDYLKVEGQKQGDIVSVIELQAKQNEGNINLLKPVSIFNIKKKEFLEKKASFKAENVHTNDALHVIDDILDILKGRMSGTFDFSWSNTGVRFSLGENFKLDSFELKLSTMDYPIISNERLNLKKGIISINKDLHVDIDADIEFKNSRISGSGLITDKDINMHIEKAKVDLLEFGPITELQLYGQSIIDLKIEGPFNNVIFNFDASAENFSFLDLKLGSIQSKFSLNINKLILDLQESSAQYKDTLFTAKGKIDFDNSNLNVDVVTEKGTYQDSLEIYYPLVRNLTFMPKDLTANYSARYKVHGGLNLDEIKTAGIIEGRGVRYLNDSVDTMSAEFSYDNNNLKIDNIRVKKASGSLSGRYQVNTKTLYMEYDSELSGLGLKDLRFYEILGLGYEGEISGEFYGNGTPDDFSSRSHVLVKNGHIGSYKADDSVLTVYTNVGDIYSSGNLLGQSAKFDSYINLNKASKKKSYIKVNIKSDDVKKMAGLLSEHNIDSDMVGNIDAAIESTFDVDEWKNLDLEMKINNFSLASNDLELSLIEGKDSIVVNKGEVRTWNIELRKNDNYFTSKGHGEISKSIRVETNFKLASSIVNMISSAIEKSKGSIEGRGVFVAASESYTNYFEFLSSDLFLKIKKLPGPFSDISFRAILEKDDLLVDHVKAKYGQGSIKADGNISFEVPYPKINLRFNVENSTIPILERSSLTITSKGELKGNEVPYLLSANVSVLHGQILEDPNKLKDTKIESGGYERFVPKTVDGGREGLINFNINVDLERPVLIKNNLAELYFDGNLFVGGSFARPNVSGQLEAVPRESKFIFKGNEFKLDEGTINLDGSQTKLDPELIFKGSSKINKYDVLLSVSGRASKLAVDLSSDPPLSSDDILSLLTIGVTSDISKDLDESQRESLTTLGLGSLIFDQFQLNENITSSLGLKVSVSPEFSQDDTSLIQGKSAVSEGGTSRVKSATKIKVQKKVSKKVDVSVSSTVGGTLEQKQEMNVNYNIDKKWSLEGVYEVRGTEEESAEDPESFGADIKYRFSF